MNPKFRIWDKVNKCWATDFTLSLEGELLCDGGTTLFIKENFEILQWTGLQDIKAKDIYIYDVVRVHGNIWLDDKNYNSYDAVILYAAELGKLLVSSERWQYSEDYDDILMANGALEVIGNIYENPELLQGED